MVETEELQSKKRQVPESFVDVPPSIQDLGSETKTKKAKVELKDIRAQHERDKLGDR